MQHMQLPLLPVSQLQCLTTGEALIRRDGAGAADPPPACSKRGTKEFQDVRTAQRGGVREQGVAQANAQVAQDCRIRQVALPARDRQLGGQVRHAGVGHAQVALAVLKVDGVHLRTARMHTMSAYLEGSMFFDMSMMSPAHMLWKCSLQPALCKQLNAASPLTCK